MSEENEEISELEGYTLLEAGARMRAMVLSQMVDGFESENPEGYNFAMDCADSVLDRMGMGAFKLDMLSNEQICYWCILAAEAEQALQYIGRQRLTDALKKIAEEHAEFINKNKRNRSKK